MYKLQRMYSSTELPEECFYEQTFRHHYRCGIVRSKLGHFFFSPQNGPCDTLNQQAHGLEFVSRSDMKSSPFLNFQTFYKWSLHHSESYRFLEHLTESLTFQCFQFFPMLCQLFHVLTFESLAHCYSISPENSSKYCPFS